jgi:hypothetical protein
MHIGLHFPPPTGMAASFMFHLLKLFFATICLDYCSTLSQRESQIKKVTQKMEEFTRSMVASSTVVIYIKHCVLSYSL